MAQTTPAVPPQTLTVGVKVAPPFVIKDGNRYSGLAIDVWKRAADAHGWKYRFKQYDLKDLLDATAAGQIAAGLGAITATPGREQRMDFSHTLVSSGLGIAVSTEQSGGALALLDALTSGPFLSTVVGMLILLLIVGTLTWAFERHRNAAQFGGNAARGIGNGMWWAAVTATTVGYGDKAPVTLPGRIIGLIWMFAALIAVAAFTAAITSALTVGKLSGRVKGPADLPHVHVASVAGTTSAAWLRQHQIHFAALASAQKALDELQAGRVDAVVYDAPLLKYLIKQGGSSDIRVLPQTLSRQDYVLILPRDSTLRKPLNETILKLLGNPKWQAQWIGSSSGLATE